MKENKKLSISSTFSVRDQLEDEDTRFLNVTVDVLHTGKNYNGSIFDKEVVDKCVDSIKNTPILGYVKIDKTTSRSDFNGHEYIITKNDNEYEEKYIGHAFGVIPESCNPRWITKKCDDGVEKEFLQVDALMWSKFDDSTSILNRDLEKGESMELDVNSVNGYFDENEIYHFTEFKFDGCCLLGDGIEPAMTNAMVAVKFSMEDFNKSIQEELNNKFKKFSKLIDEQNVEKGVETMPEEETKTPEVNETTEVDVTEVETVEEPKEETEVPTTDFSQTVNQLMSDLDKVVRTEKYTDEWGYECSRYYLTDVQETDVIVYDRMDGHYYAVPFTMSGDNPNIDFGKCKKVKMTYVPYEDGEEVVESNFNLKEHIEDIESSISAKFESEKENLEKEKAEVEANYAKLTEENETMKAKYQKYVDEENARLEAEIAEKKTAEFSKFENILGELDEFKALKEGADKLSFEEVEAKCALLFTKQALSNGIKFSKDNSTVLSSKLINEEEQVGYISTKYGNIPLTK